MKRLLLALVVGFRLQSVLGIGGLNYVTTASGPGSFTLAAEGSVAPIYVGTNEEWGVARAAGDLQRDIERVTGAAPALGHDAPSEGTPIIIGEIGRGGIIDSLAKSEKIDVSGILGKWESFLIEAVQGPMPGGVERVGDCGERQTRGHLWDL